MGQVHPPNALAIPSMTNVDFEAIIVGAGAAGLMAASTAASRGTRTLVLEKNRKLGVKILISGGTRCNLTQHTDWRGIADAYGGQQGRFLKFALAEFSPEEAVAWFEAAGVPVKTESTGKIFPASDRAIDVRDALVSEAIAAGAQLLAGTAATGIARDGADFVVTTETTSYRCHKLLVTTGGASFPGCGTTGDAYQWMAEFGHTIVECRPALVPISVVDPWARALSGITIPDARLLVRLPVEHGKSQPRDTDRGSFLFTHKGCSGPVVLNVSRAATDPFRPGRRSLECDWLPDINEESLRKHLLEGSPRRQVVSWLSEQLPRRLVESALQNAGVDLEQTFEGLGKKRAAALVGQLKRTRLDVSGTLGFAKAEVTAGGVSLDEVNPRTMESRRVPGLFIAGELLDVDGPIGGYNFQAAWSTGRLAGLSLAAVPSST